MVNSSRLSNTANTQTRRNAAQEVQALISEVASIANQQFGNRYLFGGADALNPPVELVGNYAAFRTGALTQPKLGFAYAGCPVPPATTVSTRVTLLPSTASPSPPAP